MYILPSKRTWENFRVWPLTVKLRGFQLPLYQVWPSPSVIVQAFS